MAECTTILNVFEVLCVLSRSMPYLTLHFSGSALSLLVNICSGLIWNSMMFPCLAPPRATQQTTQNPASASPHACRTALADLLRADYMARTGLGRRSMGATLDGSAAVGHARITIMVMVPVWRPPPRAAPHTPPFRLL